MEFGDPNALVHPRMEVIVIANILTLGVLGTIGAVLVAIKNKAHSIAKMNAVLHIV